ncbi:hypothetical protein Nepgr_033851 [Nepenthes gracilis]|uniref:Uncharacterized protein n=1 Tax=Nepenthes gracilis TaxID=150966 RepID=A0AAD3Y6Y5_NEPGR|nr:hypothetical protein Nepgr_033851 [Nepenthes gracilis]
MCVEVERGNPLPPKIWLLTGAAELALSVEVEVIYHSKHARNSTGVQYTQEHLPMNRDIGADRKGAASSGSRPDISGLGDGPNEMVSSDAPSISIAVSPPSMPESGTGVVVASLKEVESNELDVREADFAEQSALEPEFSGGVEEISFKKPRPALAEKSIAVSGLLKQDCCDAPGVEDDPIQLHSGVADDRDEVVSGLNLSVVMDPEITPDSISRIARKYGLKSKSDGQASPRLVDHLDYNHPIVSSGEFVDVAPNHPIVNQSPLSVSDVVVPDEKDPLYLARQQLMESDGSRQLFQATPTEHTNLVKFEAATDWCITADAVMNLWANALLCGSSDGMLPVYCVCSCSVRTDWMAYLAGLCMLPGGCALPFRTWFCRNGNMMTWIELSRLCTLSARYCRNGFWPASFSFANRLVQGYMPEWTVNSTSFRGMLEADWKVALPGAMLPSCLNRCCCEVLLVHVMDDSQKAPCPLFCPLCLCFGAGVGWAILNTNLNGSCELDAEPAKWNLVLLYYKHRLVWGVGHPRAAAEKHQLFLMEEAKMMLLVSELEHPTVPCAVCLWRATV